MKARATLVLGFATLALAVHAFEVRQVFREERFTRGNVNLRLIQAADAADWMKMDLKSTFPLTSGLCCPLTDARSRAVRTRGL